MNQYSKDRLRKIADKIDSVCNAMPHLLGLIAEIRTSSNSLSFSDNPAYSVDLSKNVAASRTVTHAAFFVPCNGVDSQFTPTHPQAQIITPLQVNTVYGGMTSQNNPIGAICGAATTLPRVNPATLSTQDSVVITRQNVGVTP